MLPLNYLNIIIDCMTRVNDLKIELIKKISAINDMGALERIYNQLDSVEPDATGLGAKITFTLKDGLVEIQEHKSFQTILEEQGYQSVTFEQFKKQADQIDWQHSIDELLDALD